MNLAPIADPLLCIKPSEKLITFIKTIDATSTFPRGIKLLLFKNVPGKENRRKIEHKLYSISEQELEPIKSENPESSSSKATNFESTSSNENEKEKLLNLEDLHWLYDYIQEQNKTRSTKIYLHELFEGSEVILPKNVEIPRSKELDARCKRLREQQQTREYNRITKNVDNIRKKLPEDTIAYQMKQINRHLIAVFQFILSVIAGFAFGFIGVELIVGNLDFGFRLLLGIICALVIALAELYFLAKKLNEDLLLDVEKSKRKTAKVD